MTNWFEVFRYELRQMFRSKAYLFMTFIVPLLALVTFYGYQIVRDAVQTNEEDTPSTPVTEANEGDEVIGLVDLTPDNLFPGPLSYPEDDCDLSNDEINAVLNVSGTTDLRSNAIKRISSPYCLRDLILYYPSFDAGKTALEDGDIELLAVIEADYAETGNVSGYVNALNIQAMSTETTIEDFVLRSLLYNVEPAEYETLYLRLRDPAYISTNQLTATGEVESENDDQSFILAYIFGLTSMLGIFWGGGYLMQSVVKEKESRIIEIVMSSVKPTALLLGKILAMGLAALLQITLILGTVVFIGTQAGDVISTIGDLEISTGTLVIALVYFLLGYLQFGSLMAAVGAISTTMRDSQNFVTVITLPAMSPFFVITLFAQEPNGTAPKILSMFPLTAPLSMIMRRAVTEVPVGEIALSMALMVIGITAAIWLAGRLFRVNILLSGSMPRFKDIPKLLRD